jgi:hypothetical protein
MKIRIGYVPNSPNLEHPADRRRIAGWAKASNIVLELDNPLQSDVLVLSNAANFGFWMRRAKQPVILDLVDGYLGENPNILKDTLRNIIRTVNGSSQLRWLTYTRHLREACKNAYAVIVASPEQKELILPMNKNVHVILDDHSELAIASSVNNLEFSIPISEKKYIFWEGYGYTIKHFETVSQPLDEFMFENSWGMYMVTVDSFAKWGGFIGKVKTKKVVKRLFPLSWANIEIIPWNLKNVVTYANKSDIALIPINLRDAFGTLKSENKLLSMWTLGLPTLFSRIPSYTRVASEAELMNYCFDEKNFRDILFEKVSNEVNFKDINSMKSYLENFHNQKLIFNQWEKILSGTWV